MDDVDGAALSLLGPDQGTSFITEIIGELIPIKSRVVFDWDNTLKVIDPTAKKIASRVAKQFLLSLKEEKACELYIISAIKPSQINMETLLMEVERLDLIDCFCPPELRTVFGKRKEVRKEYHWIQEGNIIICGYDKAEVFRAVVESEKGVKVLDKPVVFFDDEHVNIINFSNIIKGSQCYWVQ